MNSGAVDCCPCCSSRDVETIAAPELCGAALLIECVCSECGAGFIHKFTHTGTALLAAPNKGE